MDKISFSDWQKLEIEVGKILKVEEIEGADKLLKLEVDTGEKRTLVAGIKQHYNKEQLKGKKCIVLCNLEPKTMKGIKSEGMILAAGSRETNTCVLIVPEADVKPGTKIS